MNQLLKEINEGLKESNSLVKDNFITFQHEGHEYHIYKNKISDVQRLAEIEEELRTSFDIRNVICDDEDYHKLVKEYKELQEKTNWLYK